jgi:hypothetical protein
VAMLGCGSDPVGEFLILFANRNRVFLFEIGEVMSANKPTGKRKRCVQKKVDWKALEIVHPDAAGIDVEASIGWPSARIATPSRCGVSDILPPICGRWAAGWWKKACAEAAAWPSHQHIETAGLAVDALLNSQTQADPRI